MRAAQVMSDGVFSVSSDATVFEAAELLVSMHVSAMPVVDQSGRMVGIVSEADLMRRVEIGTAPHKSWLLRLMASDAASAADYVSFHSRRVTDVMTRKVITVDEDASLSDVAEAMVKHGIKRVPVMRADVVVGIVSRADLLQALMSSDPKDGPSNSSDAQLRQDVLRAVEKQPWSSAWPINVVVNACVVHLWGYTSNETVRKAYSVAAENVPGVKKVKNHLRPVPSSVSMGV